MATTTPARYEVLRHGGRAGCSWRPVHRSDSAEEARAAYEEARAALRQGGLELRGEGQVLASTWAPRLRSRW